MRAATSKTVMLGISKHGDRYLRTHPRGTRDPLRQAPAHSSARIEETSRRADFHHGHGRIADCDHKPDI